MPTVNLLDAFTYKWAQLGTVEPLSDAQWKTGWAFIGPIPPSVEEFNKWGQIFDEKSNYLYSQLNTIYALTGVVPAAADANSLRDALRGTGLFTTAAAGTSNTAAATNAFVQASKGGFARFTASGSLVVPAGVTTMYLSATSGGGAGGAGGGGGGGSFGGAGGGGGAAGQAVVRVPHTVVPGQTITITVGSGGAGVAGSTTTGATGGAGGQTVITNMSGGTVTLSGGPGGGGGVTLSGGAGAGGTAGGIGASYGADVNFNYPSGGGGAGGSGPFGGGGGGGRGATIGGIGGTDATGFGGGGGGGGGTYNSAPVVFGGSGAAGGPGLVILEWN